MSVSSLPFFSFLSGAAALDIDPVLCDDASEKWFTYGELRARLKDKPPAWQATPRGLILCAAPRTTAGAVAVLSAIASGHVTQLIDLSASRLLPFVATYKPEWIVLPAPLRPPGELYTSVDSPLEPLTLWRRAEPCGEEIHPDLCLLLSPPGPPDSAKAVRLSYANLAANVEASLEAMRPPAQARAVLPMPLAYSYGLWTLFLLLSVGGSVLLSEYDIKGRAFWEQAHRREVTLFPGVPFHYDYIARAGLEHLHAPLIKTFWQAGGRMPLERLQEMLKQINERRGAFYVLFGQPEASPRMAVLPLHEKPDKIGSSGKALRGGAFRLENDKVLYEGPNVMLGYAESRTDLAKGDEKHGVLATGEYGVLDEEGYVFLTARTKPVFL